MFALSANTLKLPTTFSPFRHSKPTPRILHPPRLRGPRPVSAAIIPPSKQQNQRLYQPFRPPPSPLPERFRSLDVNAKIDVLANRLGLWFEYAPLIPSLYTDGFTPPTIEELTGISGVEQNRLVVAAQVRDSLVGTADSELVGQFDTGGAELLYEIRLLNATQRAAAAKFILKNGFDAKRSQDLARAVKDYPSRKGEKGWEEFDYDLPGDCLAFMYYRQSREHNNPSEQRTTMLNQALEFAESEKAKNAVVREIEGETAGEEGAEEGGLVRGGVRVPVVRLRMGEVAEATSVVVLPVCVAEEGEEKVLGAPAEVGPKGDFGIVAAERGWSRWVVMPGWQPVMAVGKGGAVAVVFRDDVAALPWRKRAAEREKEAVVVIVDRTRREVGDGEYEFHLVGVGDGAGLKLERGTGLRQRGVRESLGTVVLVVRPPREEEDDQLSDEDWE